MRFLNRLGLYLVAALFVLGCLFFGIGIYNWIEQSTNLGDVLLHIVFGLIMAVGGGWQSERSIKRWLLRRKAFQRPSEG